MARDLAHLIRRSLPHRVAAPPAAMLSLPSGILDPEIARRLGKAVPRRARRISERDVLDAAMTFALTFSGAMIFLL